MSFPLLCFWFKDGVASRSEQFSKCGPAVSTSPGVLSEMYILGPLPTPRPTGLETVLEALGDSDAPQIEAPLEYTSVLEEVGTRPREEVETPGRGNVLAEA